MTKTGHIVMATVSLIVIAVLLSGCPGQTDTIVNNASSQPWLPLFNRDNLSWYSYYMINGTSGVHERLLTVEYDGEPYVHVDIRNISRSLPVKTTTVNMTWLNEDRQYHVDIYDSRLDGNNVYQLKTYKSGRFEDSLGPVLPPGTASDPNSTWLIHARAYDLAAYCDADSSLHVSGFGFMAFNGTNYYCSVYESGNDPDFRAWRNASLPVPVKIVANYSISDSTYELWTFELRGWD